jgi:hypothetical protein
MRPSTRLLASAAPTSALRPAALALLPPIPLYRRLLRAHRKHLPSEMRVLGDEYIKAEFRAHRNIDNPVHVVSIHYPPPPPPPPVPPWGGGGGGGGPPPPPPFRRSR